MITVVSGGILTVLVNSSSETYSVLSSILFLTPLSVSYYIYRMNSTYPFNCVDVDG